VSIEVAKGNVPMMGSMGAMDLAQLQLQVQQQTIQILNEIQGQLKATTLSPQEHMMLLNSLQQLQQLQQQAQQLQLLQQPLHYSNPNLTPELQYFMQPQLHPYGTTTLPQTTLPMMNMINMPSAYSNLNPLLQPQPQPQPQQQQQQQQPFIQLSQLNSIPGTNPSELLNNLAAYGYLNRASMPSVVQTQNAALTSSLPMQIPTQQPTNPFAPPVTASTLPAVKSAAVTAASKFHPTTTTTAAVKRPDTNKDLWAVNTLKM
jgi:DNA polymerase III gamma/tau subunit